MPLHILIQILLQILIQINIQGDTVIAGNKTAAIRIINRHHFSSELKRMSTVVQNVGTPNECFALVKGAPETLKSRV